LYTIFLNIGGVISPFNAWLITRGAATLPLRVRQHNANAQKVAEYLDAHPKVKHVSYPGLPSHPGHAVAKKQMLGGFGGMIAFTIDTDHDGYNKFVSDLKLIISAVSLGHDTSLIVFIGEDDERQYLYPAAFHNGFLRFSVGLEEADDIIADLAQALRSLY
jgi:cystathionine beta-lyase/cystathionine gamma-synthase